MSGSLSGRDPSQIPFASDSVFNLPLGLGAQWQSNDQLASSNIFINTTLTGYNENIYTGTASDPLVTVTNTGQAGGTAGTFQVHIPAGAVPADGADQAFSVDDTTTGTWYSFGGFGWTGANTATVTQGSAESDSGSGLQVDGSNWDQGVGTLRESDLQAGSINHMLRIELPTSMLQSVSSSAYQLAANAWPQNQEDGNGPSVYTGTIPYGVTIGIPANAVEPADIAANAGADMLWHELQDHGAMIRDSGGSGNTVTFQADQNVSESDPLVQGMMQYGGEIMAQAEILANQGPGSVNGGGTPIVPLDPPVGGGSDDGSDTAATATATVTATPTPTPTATQPQTAATQASATQTIADGETSTTVSASNETVSASGGDHMVFVSGDHNVFSLSGGLEQFTDKSAGSNTFNLPAAGNGVTTFNSEVLVDGDTFNLTSILAGTKWDGSAGTIGNYLSTQQQDGNTSLLVSSDAFGPTTFVASFNGNQVGLSDILAHSIT